MSFSNPVSLSSAVPTFLLLSLPPLSVTSPISASIPHPVVFFSGLISGPTVVEESDVVCSYMTLEGCVGAGAATSAGTFGVELYAHFPDVCSLRTHDSVPVMIIDFFLNCSITLIRGSTPGLLSSSAFHCCPKFPRLIRLFPRRQRSLISFAHRDLVPASLPRQGGLCPTHPDLPLSATIRTL